MLNLLSNAIKYNKPDDCIDTYAEELSCGGTIEAESQLGKGTKTTVILLFMLAAEEQIQEEREKEKKFVPEDIWQNICFH